MGRVEHFGDKIRDLSVRLICPLAWLAQFRSGWLL